MARLTAEELARWVGESCARHAVPVKVTDAVVVTGVALLLAGRMGRSGAERRTADRSGSEPPDDIDSAGIKPSSANGSGSDHDVIDHSADDGVLPGEVQATPLSP